jgi:mono/diheme cytochrome c family protein
LAGTVSLAAGICFILAGCHTDMWRQPKVGAQQPISTTLFQDGRADRLPVQGTVARGGLRHDDLRYTGFEGGKLATRMPATIVVDGETLSTTDPRDLERIIRRGKERFQIFCQHCHGALGDGKGMIAQRGLALRRQPGDYHTDRLRQMPIGHFYDVITNGYGVMFSYASRVDPDDRWAISSYVRALQLSRYFPVASLPPADLDMFLGSAEAARMEAHGE